MNRNTVLLFEMVKTSILDRSFPFNGGDWCWCIAAHALRVQAEMKAGAPISGTEWALRLEHRMPTLVAASEFLELSSSEARYLFYTAGEMVGCDRLKAIAIIDEMIDRHQRQQEYMRQAWGDAMATGPNDPPPPPPAPVRELVQVPVQEFVGAVEEVCV